MFRTKIMKLFNIKAVRNYTEKLNTSGLPVF